MRKRRTRNHIIEDLGLNYVERQFLLAGHSVQRIYRDYGYDANIFTYDENGEFENGIILLQLKSTDFLKIDVTGNFIDFSLSKRDLELWLSGKEMMILVIYDAELEVAYYLDLQEYFRQERLSLIDVKKYILIKIPIINELNLNSVQIIKKLKNENY